jgi:Na+-translocating ferredoxin:NAD+ oxidoreductase RNF subunit RnfB
MKLKWAALSALNASPSVFSLQPSAYNGPDDMLLKDYKLEIFKTNCGKCGQPTCTVVAAQAMEGGRGAEDCPELDSTGQEKLANYLAGFRFD